MRSFLVLLDSFEELIQLIKTHNEDRIYVILHFLTNILYFVILSGYSSVGNQHLEAVTRREYR